MKKIRIHRGAQTGCELKKRGIGYGVSYWCDLRDGIGPEIVAEAKKVLDKAGENTDIRLRIRIF